MNSSLHCVYNQDTHSMRELQNLLLKNYYDTMDSTCMTGTQQGSRGGSNQAVIHLRTVPNNIRLTSLFLLPLDTPRPCCHIYKPSVHIVSFLCLIYLFYYIGFFEVTFLFPSHLLRVLQHAL